MAAKGASGRKSAKVGRRWSSRVTRTSDALDLDPGLFTRSSARAIASSLKRSADRSRRRKTDSFRSAMSMLTFYVNRAGKTLSADRKRLLQDAKEELRSLYHRPPARPSPRARH
jgi:hypothetical protein